MEKAAIIFGLICFLMLMFQRRFWLLAFGIGSVASCLALLDSLFHYRIMTALGYFCLMLVCWLFANAIADDKPRPTLNKKKPDSHFSHKDENPDWSPP